MLERTGPVPEGCNWITLGDRASDIFLFVEVLRKLGYGCVLRTKHDRKIIVNGSEHNLKQYMRSLPAMAEKQHIARSVQDHSSHEQTLKISWTAAEMLSPKSEKEKNPFMDTICGFGAKRILILNGFYLRSTPLPQRKKL